MPKKTIENAANTVTTKVRKAKATAQNVVDRVENVVEQGEQVVNTFNRKRSLIEMMGVKNPLVAAALAAIATAIGFFTGAIPL